MKIYLASRYINKDTLRFVRNELHSMGHEVTSRWLDCENSDRIEQAIMDLEDIDRADALVLWPDNVPQPERPYGGMYVEFGYALAKNKKLFLVYPESTTSIFVELPEVSDFTNWSDFYSFMQDKTNYENQY
jgi:nucleoside 2-deoxyribosyltransferase